MARLGLRPGPDRGRAVAASASAAGAFLGSRLGPLLLEEGSKSPYAPLTALMGALVIGGILASLFEVLGFRVRRALRMRGRRADPGGRRRRRRRCCSPSSGSGVAWIAGAVALQTPGLEDVRRDIQRSSILGAAERDVPAVGPGAERARPLRPDPERRRARGRRAAADVADRARPAGQGGGAAASSRCWAPPAAWASRGRAGSAARRRRRHERARRRRPGRHDRAGRGRGRRTTTPTLIWFDETNDLALLRVPGDRGQRAGARASTSTRSRAPRPRSSASRRTAPTTSSRRGSGQTREVLSDDAYGNGPITRRVTSLRGRVRSGNSGGPLVDGDGEVVGTIFASTLSGRRPQRAGRAGFGRRRRARGNGRSEPVSRTGRAPDDARLELHTNRHAGPTRASPPRRYYSAVARFAARSPSPQLARRCRRRQRQPEPRAAGRSREPVRAARSSSSCSAPTCACRRRTTCGSTSRRAAGKTLLRAANSINSRGDGPGRAVRHAASGPYTTTATQKIWRRGGGKCTVHAPAPSSASSSSPARTATGSTRTPRASRSGRSTACCARRAASAPGPKVILLPARPAPHAGDRAARRGASTTRPAARDGSEQTVTLGTSVGWSDIYPATYHEQWIDVTGLRGTFAFKHIADPENGIWESDEIEQRGRSRSCGCRRPRRASRARRRHDPGTPGRQRR